MIMKHHQSTFTGLKQQDLYYQNWLPESKMKGVLVLVHGLGGHSGMYQNIVNHLLIRQYAIYAFDLPGHGLSPGIRAYIDTWSEYTDNLRIFIDFVKTQHGEIPLFLYGHSMGGMIVIDYTLKYPEDNSLISGVIACAPSVGQVTVSPLRLFLGKLLSNIYPQFSLDTGFDINAGSRDKEVIKGYTQDKLRHTRGTARLSTEFFKTLRWIYNHVEKWQVPLLILHGSADRVTLPEGSKRFYEKVNYVDKLRIEYEGAYHDLHCDINYAEVMEDLSNWMDQHLSNYPIKL
ncbi:lysophospholipase [Anabaena sp. FACHB-1237]|nr:lysophospholipase [Anabaena sp. FACHB-1237]